MINYYIAKTKWEGPGGVREFFDTEVFALDSNVTPSNTDVDQRFGLPETSISSAIVDIDSIDDRKYQDGLARKTALLESGLAYVEDGSSKRDGLSISRLLHLSWLAFLILLWCIMAFVGLVLAFLFVRFLTRHLMLF